MNGWLNGEICPQCGKKFFIRDRKSYLYKIKGKKSIYLCSYNCTNKMKETIENEKILASNKVEVTA